MTKNKLSPMEASIYCYSQPTTDQCNKCCTVALGCMSSDWTANAAPNPCDPLRAGLPEGAQPSDYDSKSVHGAYSKVIPGNPSFMFRDKAFIANVSEDQNSHAYSHAYLNTVGGSPRPCMIGAFALSF